MRISGFFIFLFLISASARAVTNRECLEPLGEPGGAKAPATPPAQKKGNKPPSLPVVTVKSHDGRELKFEVYGRTPAENRFKREEKEIEEAKDEDLVPIEWNIHPQYTVLYHTSLRIGNSLFTKGKEGWKMHAGGKASPRAFLHNPFIKASHEKLKDQGMPSFSVGITFRVPKAQAVALREDLAARSKAEGKDREKFQLLLSNCNQGPCRAVRKAGIDIPIPWGPKAFSTALTMRKLILEGGSNVQGLSLYPLPNTTTNPDELAAQIPAVLYQKWSLADEVKRIVHDFRVFGWDPVPEQPHPPQP